MAIFYIQDRETAARRRQLSGVVWLVALCSLSAAMIAGCNRGPSRVMVAGEVTYRGQPVSQGSVSFYPCDGTGGAPVVVVVKDGRYKADSLGGVPEGKYRVVILGVRTIPGRLPPDNEVQYIPPKYNNKSELRLTVQPGSGPITKDFAMAD